MNKFPLLLAAATALAPLATAQNVAEELKALRERIDEIEDMQIDTADRLGDRALIQAFEASSFDLGGHVSSLFTAIDGEASTEVGHLVSLVELYIKAEIDDEWSIFASPGFYTFNGGLLDNPATPTVAGDPTFSADTNTVENVFISRVYGQWRPSDKFVLQGGRVGSPHGTTNREYFIPARTVATASLHTRLFTSNQLFPGVLRGLKASGKLAAGESDWVEYDAYFGGESDSAADGIGGARLAYTFGDLGLTAAANYGRGTRQAAASVATNVAVLLSPFLAGFNTTRDYQFGGLDIDWRQGDFIFKGEAYYSAEDGFRDQRALSSELTYFVHPQWGLTYRYDFYDRGSDLNVFLPTPAIVNTGHSTEHVVGVSFNPSPSVRLRLDLHHNNLPNSPNTVQFANFSWSISF